MPILASFSAMRSNRFISNLLFQMAQTISADKNKYNLVNELTAAGWDGIKPVNATITINSGIVVYSDTTATAAFDIPTTIPAGSTINIINNGYIVGMGGAGGGNSISQVGQNGGPAMNVAVACSITNNGTIGGGGGGGGYCGVASFSSAGGGGGRSGRVNSAGGASNTFPGGAGTFAAAGAGGVNSGRIGGTGGNWGATGGTATGGRTNYAGGAGGAAVVGNSYVTWLAIGTRMGALS